MAALQKPLRGYSDFIGRYTGGNVNLEDSTVLVPVLEMADFLNERRNQAFQVNFTAGGQYASVVVPDGERWRIHYAGSTSNAGAGQRVYLSTCFVKNFGGAAFFGYLDPRGVYATLALGGTDPAAGFGTGSGSTRPDLILDGGDEVGLILDAVVAGGAGPFNCTFMVQYTRWLV